MNGTHAFQVLVWRKAGDETLLFEIPYWMEMARCITEWRAKEVAVCLSLRHHYVAMARLDEEGRRFVQVAWWPDEATVKQATVV